MSGDVVLSNEDLARYRRTSELLEIRALALAAAARQLMADVDRHYEAVVPGGGTSDEVDALVEQVRISAVWSALGELQQALSVVT